MHIHGDKAVLIARYDIDDFKAGKTPQPGSYAGRRSSEPQGGAKTLLDETLYDGRAAQPIAKLPNSDPEPAKEPA